MFCEGGVTEPQYLNALRREPEIREKAAVDITVNDECAGFAPLSLVQRAVDFRQHQQDTEGEVDEVWCVFDVEWPQNHPNLQDALSLARKNGVQVAVSNPCFELWLILHCQDHTAYLQTSEAVRLRAQLDSTKGKAFDPAIYMPKRRDAVARAKALVRKHDQDESYIPHDNPSSTPLRPCLRSLKPLRLPLAKPEGLRWLQSKAWATVRGDGERAEEPFRRGCG